ncbi:MAG: response regulator transcription factor [bacterium]|nr:response regulator transcription factor [bacterium]MDE0352482.1 response regulator transcription factor [bacterium]
MIRVFLVDDHRLFLSGVRTELSDPRDIELIGSAGDVDDAIDALRLDPPDVALVDVHMPGGGGLAILENVLQTHPQVKFLALSVSDAAEDVIAMIRAGARGYVTKSIRPEALVDAIRRVHAGDAVFSPMLAGFVLDTFAATIPAPEDPELDQLTTREQEVLRLIARGFSYKQVAHRLYISHKTVESHVSAVLRKLQLSNRYELANWASRRRIV